MESHPFGVQPSGNIALVAHTSKFNVRLIGLGRLLNKLSDEAIINMLSHLEARDLISLSQSSRILYVFCNHSDLWRDLYLSRWGQDIEFVNTWRDSFARRWHLTNSKNVGELPPLVQPIKIDGVYSNLLHRTWLCSTFNVTAACPGFMKHADIDIVDLEQSLSVTEFVEKYEKPNIPCLFKGLIKSWPAYKKWDFEYLTRFCGEKKFRATSATAPAGAQFTMQQYIQYCHSVKEEAPLYLFERDFGNDLEVDYEVPNYFSKYAEHGSDLFRLLGDQRRPDYRWLIVGPARSGSIFHIDPNQTNAWNACVRGRKKWIFYPRGVSPPGVMSSPDGADVTIPISLGEWLLTFWKFHLDCRNDPDESRRPLEIIAYPGDVLFVPHGYWHMVINLDDCIALTHNYVSTSNLANCLAFLRDKVDQISGVRDRDDAIRPEDMYQTFVNSLTTVLSPDIISGELTRSLIDRKDFKRKGYKRKRIASVIADNVFRFDFSVS